jgi:hypothetical protein
MRPRPSDDPVMNTRATSRTSSHRADLSACDPEWYPCAPRVFLHSVHDTPPQRCALMAAINFVRTPSNSAYGSCPWGLSAARTCRNLGPGHKLLRLTSPRTVYRPARQSIGKRPIGLDEAGTAQALRFSCTKISDILARGTDSSKPFCSIRESTHRSHGLFRNVNVIQGLAEVALLWCQRPGKVGTKYNFLAGRSSAADAVGLTGRRIGLSRRRDGGRCRPRRR